MREGDIFDGSSGESYETKGELGRGGMGIVHLVTRLTDNVDFVAKSPLEDTDLKKRKIHNEYNVLMKIEEAGIRNVATAHEKGTFLFSGQEMPLLIMKMAEGTELNKILTSQKVSVSDTKDILHKIAVTMSEVHSLGYIHRDLKPDNIFVDDIGGTNNVTIIDWGIAAIKEDHETFAITTSVAHTKFYAPPEQAKGTVSIGNDIFSLGATGYAMLVGAKRVKRDIDNSISPPYDPVHAFHNNTIEDLHLFEVIKKATWKDRGGRFATMEDMEGMIEGKPPAENFPRFIVDGKAYPLLPEKSIWSLGSTWSPEADILVKETSPRGNHISRIQAKVERMGQCAFKLHHFGKNNTRICMKQEDGSPIWEKIEKDGKGYPLGPRYLEICFGYSNAPPNKNDENGNPLSPGPYKVIEYFPPSTTKSID
jgi:serine/threonine-protein kinase